MACQDEELESVAAGSLAAGTAAGSIGEGLAASDEALAGGISPAGHGAAPKPSAARARKDRRQRKAMTCVLLAI